MEVTKQEKKVQKKAFKKARKKAIRPWRFLTWLSGPLAVILAVACVFVGMFDNTVALFVGDSFWELEMKIRTQSIMWRILQHRKKE